MIKCDKSMLKTSKSFIRVGLLGFVTLCTDMFEGVIETISSYKWDLQ